MRSVRQAETAQGLRLAPQGEGATAQHVSPCHKAYHREHYLANKQRYIKQARVSKELRRLERTLSLLEFFVTHPCVDCGETDPVVLEFDHIEDKSFEITKRLPDKNWCEWLDEIAKCEVVCANCHRRRTAERRGALRWTLKRQLRGLTRERATGIEPVPRPWKGRMQPLTPRPRGR